MNLPTSKLVRSQKKTFIKSGVMIDGEKVDVIATVRYDDQCGNRHNSFAITGEVYKAGRRGGRSLIMCGCIHDAINQAFPELAPLIKWHLCSSDGPMHYVANSLYHARTCDTKGAKAGDVIAHEEILKFGGLPIEFKEQERGFFKFLKDSDFSALEVEAVEHEDKGGRGYKFAPKYTFKGFSDEWHNCPFDTKREAENFLLALQAHDPHFAQVPSEWAKAVTPELDKARNAAIWPDAELSDFTEEKLTERLPVLMAEFKQAVESLGFEY